LCWNGTLTKGFTPAHTNRRYETHWYEPNYRLLTCHAYTSWQSVCTRPRSHCATDPPSNCPKLRRPSWHSNRVYDAVTAEHWSEVDGIWEAFWQSIPCRHIPLLQAPLGMEFCKAHDRQMYSRIVDALIPDVFRCMSSTLTKEVGPRAAPGSQCPFVACMPAAAVIARSWLPMLGTQLSYPSCIFQIRNFAKHLEDQLSHALRGLPDSFVQMKVSAGTASAFGHPIPCVQATWLPPCLLHQERRAPDGSRCRRCPARLLCTVPQAGVETPSCPCPRRSKSWSAFPSACAATRV